jgi:hypothetical protein
VITKFPRILEYKSERTIRPRLDFLRACGVEQSDLAKVNPTHLVHQCSSVSVMLFCLETALLLAAGSLARCPHSHPHHRSITARHTFLDRTPLSTHLSVPPQAQVFMRAPMALELRVRDTLEPRAAFLRDVLCLSPGALGKLIVRHPQVRPRLAPPLTAALPLHAAAHPLVLFCQLWPCLAWRAANRAAHFPWPLLAPLPHFPNAAGADVHPGDDAAAGRLPAGPGAGPGGAGPRRAGTPAGVRADQLHEPCWQALAPAQVLAQPPSPAFTSPPLPPPHV